MSKTVAITCGLTSANISRRNVSKYEWLIIEECDKWTVVCRFDNKAAFSVLPFLTLFAFNRKKLYICNSEAEHFMKMLHFFVCFRVEKREK